MKILTSTITIIILVFLGCNYNTSNNSKKHQVKGAMTSFERNPDNQIVPIIPKDHYVLEFRNVNNEFTRNKTSNIDFEIIRQSENQFSIINNALKIRIVNRSFDTIAKANSGHIERWENTFWRMIPNDSLTSYINTGSILNYNDTLELYFSLPLSYNFSSGKYRIVKEFYLDGEEIRYYVGFAEFLVE